MNTVCFYIYLGLLNFFSAVFSSFQCIGLSPILRDLFLIISYFLMLLSGFNFSSQFPVVC